MIDLRDLHDKEPLAAEEHESLKATARLTVQPKKTPTWPELHTSRAFPSLQRENYRSYQSKTKPVPVGGKILRFAVAATEGPEDLKYRAIITIHPVSCTKATCSPVTNMSLRSSSIFHCATSLLTIPSQFLPKCALHSLTLAGT